MIILDTCILIDRDLYVFDENETYAASILSRAELESGLRTAATPEQRAERAQLLNALDAQFDWLPFDLECTRAYGEITAGITAHGTGALIAAQAYRFGANVISENFGDFAPFWRFVRVNRPTPKP
ncbi:MAG: type II toxin-antitoxin system VapC family toxin [Promicromonosporaceae bacterium]|nr:type II toxin-antitoxin system VapC family toxin [Promicromonosporaceae bacterium]